MSAINVLSGSGRLKARMHRGREYMAGFGTGGSLLAGAAMLFVLASALVAFNGWPALGSSSNPASVFVSASSRAAPASPGVSQLLAAGPHSTATAARAGSRHGGPVSGGHRPGHSGHGGVPGGSGGSGPGSPSGSATGAPSGSSGLPLVGGVPSGPGLPSPGGTVSQVTKTVNNTVSQVTNAPKAVGGTIVGTTNAVGSTVTSTGNAVGSTVSNGSPPVGGAVSQTGTTISNTVTTVGNTLGNTVTNGGGSLGGGGGGPGLP